MTAARRTNWAGNVVFSAEVWARPRSVDELQALVAASPRLRILGAGHSFNPIADSPHTIVSLADLPGEVTVGPDNTTVAVTSALRYAEVTAALDRRGLALANLGSLPHISVAGACATGTHGSGRRNGNLATAVVGLEFVDGRGELVTLARATDPGEFDGAVVALGALGAVTRLTLAVEPSYEVAQTVYEHLGVTELRAHLDEILDAAYSVSLFTTWRSLDVDQVWCKSRLDTDAAPGPELFGARTADGPRHPIPGFNADSSTEQLGTPGPWNARLPHFRAEFTPSAGDELQSEYLLPRAHALEAFDALGAIAEDIAPLLLVSEIRTVAADALWMSPSYERDTVAFHFTWVKRPEPVRAVLARVEAALAPFAPRPHWGKVFVADPAEVAARYPRRDDFIALLDRYDPEEAFINPFVAALLDR